MDDVTGPISFNKVQLMYVDQSVPPITRIPYFEEYSSETNQPLNVYWNMINKPNVLLTPEEPNFSGIRVVWYQQILQERCIHQYNQVFNWV